MVLVRNEDLLVERSLRNAARFCDEWIFCDHGSTDRTAVLLAELAKTLPGVRNLRISHPRESHELLRAYAGRPCWIFGLDGDEIYDPSGLARLRSRLLAGDFRDWWMILGNVLHVARLSPDKRRAEGYLSPPCRSMTKLYNFEAIRSWDGDCVERLHGGSPLFHAGFSADKRLNMYESCSWDHSDFRCLHLCFQARSSADPPGAVRQNIMETLGTAGWRRRLASIFSGKRDWKKERYMRGPLVSIDASPFFAGDISAAS